MTNRYIARLSRANPVRELKADASRVDALLEDIFNSTSHAPSTARSRLRDIGPLATVLAVTLTGAALAAGGSAIITDAPDSPSDPPTIAPRVHATSVTPLSRSDVAASEADRQAAIPAVDAQAYFSAIGGISGADYRDVYRSDAGLVEARASDREVCVRYRTSKHGDVTGSCVPTIEAKTLGAYVWVQCADVRDHPQRRTIAGIAPDGVSVVQGEGQGVVRATTAVQANGFILTTNEPIDVIDLDGARRSIGPATC